MTEKTSSWKTISIRQELIKEVEEVIKTGRYRSISEFVSEAIRLRLEELMRNQGITVIKRKETPAMPETLLYTPKHTWCQVTPEGNVRVGISDYAQQHLKGLANVRTEPVGKEVNRMESFGVAETWMFMFDLYAPVSGTIIKVNENLKNDPHVVNEDPYSAGWIVEIKPKNSIILQQELNSLMGHREYNQWVGKLKGRLRE
jgi:glycine cleavage system H protein